MSKNRRYSVEFKKEAVRLMVIEGRPTAELAEELGIQHNLLYRWKSEYVELRKAERTIEILRKTVGYFAEGK